MIKVTNLQEINHIENGSLQMHIREKAEAKTTEAKSSQKKAETKTADTKSTEKKIKAETVKNMQSQKDIKKVAKAR